MPSKLESRVSKHDRRIAQHDREIAAIRKPIVQGMTIDSAMGINWTNIRYDDPFGRGFEYVPSAASDTYGPINELWG